jgi:hypothetical protein
MSRSTPEKQRLDSLQKVLEVQYARIERIESRVARLERRNQQMDATIGRMREIFRQQGFPRI